MKSTSFRKALVPGVAVLALALSACGASNEEGGGDGGKTLSGGGASSQAKAQSAWQAGYQTANKGVTVNYNPIGSGTGRENFISGAYAFAGTDSALSDKEGELTKAKEHCGSDVIQVPAYVSPIAVAFNVDGVDELNLSAKVVANIFNGTITTWNDPAIAELNPDAKLPAEAINTVHRQDDSGTTENFTKYLAAAGEGAWTAEPDGVWPADIKGGDAAEGTSGLISVVKSTPFSIGYADHSGTKGLSVAKIKVGESFNAPTAEGAAATFDLSKPSEGVGATDMAVDLARDTTDSSAYPVVLVSYLVACSTYDSQETADLVKGYLTYVVSDAGQQAAASEDAAGSAPLSGETSAKATELVSKIAAK